MSPQRASDSLSLNPLTGSSLANEFCRSTVSTFEGGQPGLDGGIISPLSYEGGLTCSHVCMYETCCLIYYSGNVLEKLRRGIRKGPRIEAEENAPRTDMP